MKYEIRLTLTHYYGQPAEVARHRVRVVPLDIAGVQSVTDWSLSGDPAPSERRDGFDFFGTPDSFVSHDLSHTAMRITMNARVERFALDPQVDLSARLHELPGEIERINSLGAAAPHHFLGGSPRITQAPDVVAYAQAETSESQTTRAAVWDLCQALHRDLQFDGNATTVDTPLEVAFQQRRGVCQDFAHIMIAGLRGLGVPARYVSGYLRTRPPEGKARLEGADAMHAWVSAWCGVDAGWVELDPTNGVEVNTDHIVVGYGRDYSDVSPIKGMLRSSGQASVSQAVDVIPMERD